MILGFLLSPLPLLSLPSSHPTPFFFKHPSHPKQRVDLKLDVGEGGLDYAEVAKKEHLSELELEIRKLNDKVKDVLAEQAYQRTRELEFRKTSEAIHSKQQYWSLFQIAVMVAACYIQVTTLQRYFRNQDISKKK